jgi:hypothetical protein
MLKLRVSSKRRMRCAGLPLVSPEPYSIVSVCCAVAATTAWYGWCLDERLCGPVALFARTLLTVTSLLSLLLCFLDPGLILKQSHHDGSILPLSYALCSLRCELCDMCVPDYSHHCAVCNVCVMHRNHHCFVIGQCVGSRNVWAFYALLMCVMCTAVLLLVLSFYRTMGLEPFADVYTKSARQQGP